MLQRMNELAVQSANGTNSDTDRQAIQDEVDQLTKEIDRVSETTKFNETYLLKGDPATAAKATFMKSGYSIIDAGVYAEGSNTKITTSDDLKKAIASGSKIYTAAKDDGQDDTKLATNGKEYAYVTKLYDKNGKQVSAENVKAGKMADGNTEAADGYFLDKSATGYNVKKDKGADFIRQFDVNGALSFNLHVGADSASDNKISVKIDSMSAGGIGVKGLQVDTEDDATAAIDRISEAISKVSSQRSSLGAVQNRLEHTINNLDNVSENTTSAESRIRDTDMAKEMVNYSKNNILAQAGQSMLAQANQSNQGVLSLLQ